MKRKEDMNGLTARQRAGYLLVRWLGWIQQLIYRHWIGDLVWRTANGECIPLSRMRESHLRNAYLVVCRRKDDFRMKMVLADELRSRGIEPPQVV